MTNCIDHGKQGDKHGYARVRHNGAVKRAHRVAFCLAKGLDITQIDGLVVRHTCDNTRCVRPSHLVLGTQKENVQDMISRGRRSKTTAPVLTPEQVAYVKANCVPVDLSAPRKGADTSKSFAGLASELGVTHSAVRRAFIQESK